MNPTTCQATKSNPVEIVVPSQSPDGPYRLCTEAAERLHTRTLRPLEWFRLASIHSPFEFYLHDDFYDDSGTATCPDGIVIDAALYPFPQLSDFQHNSDMLISYAITQWRLKEPELKAMKNMGSESLIEALKARRRITQNPHILSLLYEICGCVIGRPVEAWVRNEHALLNAREERLSLLWFAGTCLPTADARQLLNDELSELRGAALVDKIFVLSQFRDESTLAWIEDNVCEPLTGPWGNLAAVVGLDWNRAARWLRSGRPLSLIALDALVTCDSPRPNQSQLVQEACHRLLDSPGEKIISECLNHCLEHDSAPRVRMAIEHIVSRIENIQRPE